MTPERAEELRQEILKLGGWHPISITEEEESTVRMMWATMPGYTCFYDAVARIANGEPVPENCPTCNNLKHIRNAGAWISCPDCNVKFIGSK